MNANLHSLLIVFPLSMFLTYQCFQTKNEQITKLSGEKTEIRDELIKEKNNVSDLNAQREELIATNASLEDRTDFLETLNGKHVADIKKL